MVYFAEYPSPLGKMMLTADENSLIGLRFDADAHGVHTGESEVLTRVKRWLDGYFSGAVLPVDFALAPEGTAFQKLVWQILLTIPAGQTRTYGDIAKEAARRLGKEKMSAQAAGQAVGKNPISIVIPCHRVIGAQGQLTGYAWGLEKKQWLLQHEQKMRNERIV